MAWATSEIEQRAMGPDSGERSVDQSNTTETLTDDKGANDCCERSLYSALHMILGKENQTCPVAHDGLHGEAGVGAWPWGPGRLSSVEARGRPEGSCLQKAGTCQMHLGLGGGVFWAEVTIPGGGRKGGRCGKTGVGLGVDE